MSDFISRQEAIDELYKIDSCEDRIFVDAIIYMLENLPSHEGRWIVHNYSFGKERYECDQCHERANMAYTYCPNCGSLMNG